MDRRDFLKGVGAAVPAVFAADILEETLFTAPGADAFEDFRQPVDITATVVEEAEAHYPELRDKVLYADPYAGPFSASYACSGQYATSAMYRTAGPSLAEAKHCQMMRKRPVIDLKTTLVEAKKLLSGGF